MALTLTPPSVLDVFFVYILIKINEWKNICNIASIRDESESALTLILPRHDRSKAFIASKVINYCRSYIDCESRLSVLKY
jgi:hypothetical protein